MLNVTTVGLLVGSLFVGVPSEPAPTKAGDCDELNYRLTHVEECEATETSEVEPLVTDAFAFGHPSDASRFRFWVEYAYGQTADTYWGPGGSEIPFAVGGFTPGTAPPGFPEGSTGKITSQRAAVGAEIGVLHTPDWKVAVGGQLGLASNSFSVEEPGAGSLVPEDIDSGFGLQGVKAYGQIKGRVVGIHGGYMFDMGSEREYEPVIGPDGTTVIAMRPTSLSNSDGRDAIFFGGDFDYANKGIRIFAGADYFMIQKGGQDDPNTPTVDETELEGDDVVSVLMGLGVRFGILEIGPAVLVQSRLGAPTVPEVAPPGTGTMGGHAITFAPYIRISPPTFPVSLSVRGAVRDEYTEFGYPLTGSNSVKPELGFTVGLTYGFD